MNASLELFAEVSFANVARYAQRLGERIVNWAVARDDRTGDAGGSAIARP
jgi:hypothetical protein